MISPGNLYRAMRGRVATTFVREVTPKQAYPSETPALHVPSESVETRDAPGLPLSPECRHLWAESHRSREERVAGIRLLAPRDRLHLDRSTRNHD